MPSKPVLSGGALLALLLTAACQPQTQRSGVGQNYGQDQERYMRGVQVEGARSGASPAANQRGIQNAPVTGINPSTTGIERAPTR